MSVAEVFLRAGTPSTTLDHFISTQTTPCESWRWVMSFPRQWHHDALSNTLSAPVFHMLFTQEQADHSPDAPWHLVYATVQGNAQDEDEITTIFKDVWENLPIGLLPTSVMVMAYVEGSTHQRLGLLNPQQWTAAVETLRPLVTAGSINDDEAKKRRISFASAVIIQKDASSQNAAEDTALLEPQCTVSATFTEWVAQATLWVSTRSAIPAARDVSIPAQHDSGMRELIRLLPDLPVSMWRARYADATSIERMRQEPLEDLDSLSGAAKLRAQREAGRDTHKRKNGDWTTFTITTNNNNSTTACEKAVSASTAAVVASSTTAAGQGAPLGGDVFRHVVYLQKSFVHKKPIDLDNRDVGPLTPQPIGAEIHILPDAGDAIRIAEQLADTGMLEFHYEDSLHEEGELLVQLAPVEGVPFAAIDVLLALMDAEPQRFAALSHTQPALCEGSCSGLVFPRVVLRKPTGQQTKVNPIAATHAEVHLYTPSADMVAQAAAALRYAAQHVTALDPPAVGYYTLTDEKPIRVSDHFQRRKQCGWCGRLRTRLLRCGACRCAWYCCQAHQKQDWKEGEHKSVCAMWKQAREWQEKQLAPALAAMSPAERASRMSIGASCAATLLDVLTEHAADGNNKISYLHYVGLPDSQCIDDMLQSLSSAAAQFDNQPRQIRVVCFADKLDARHHNAVFAFYCDGTSEALPSTGQLGDVWHVCGGGGNKEPHDTPAAAPRLLLRLCASSSYHNYEMGAEERQALSAVVAMSPLSGEGLSFFSGSLRKLSELAGVVPLRMTDSALVGAAKTASALVSTLGDAITTTTAAARAAQQQLTPCTVAKRVSEGVKVCPALMCTEPVLLQQQPSEDQQQQSADGGARDEVPLYANAFQFQVVPPSQ